MLLGGFAISLFVLELLLDQKFPKIKCERCYPPAAAITAENYAGLGIGQYRTNFLFQNINGIIVSNGD